MKIDNKGFAISTIMYLILILALILISLTLAILSNRKLILDKLSEDVLNNIYPSTNECIGEGCGDNTEEDYSDYYCRVTTSGDNSNITCGDDTYTKLNYGEGDNCYYIADYWEDGFNFSGENGVHSALDAIEKTFEWNNVQISAELPTAARYVEMGYCWQDQSEGYKYSCSGNFVCSKHHWLASEDASAMADAVTNVNENTQTCSISTYDDESIFVEGLGFRHVITINISYIGGYTGDTC